MDRFLEVYDRFARGIRQDESVNLLLDQCLRSPASRRKLVAKLEEASE